ncbi:hypothetical protein B9Z55_000415 [Caenorhabditis nigoni]|uniref:Uncharacterized protein n=1 Tax=Caenorhabditis nigoni TaxID=1611254 RepID=A0A2G5VTD3_9PELO|nr:hypothetical protein B9Z55_000415 [Caenorhabditis nigoni]
MGYGRQSESQEIQKIDKTSSAKKNEGKRDTHSLMYSHSLSVTVLSSFSTSAKHLLLSDGVTVGKESIHDKKKKKKRKRRQLRNGDYEKRVSSEDDGGQRKSETGTDK